MEGFKSLPKMQHFKEGGSVQREIANYEKRERKVEEKQDEAQDKKIVKKAFSIHDAQQHEEKTNLKGLKKGGRAKKDAGTVRKYKTGGAVLATGGSDVAKDGGKKTGGADIKTGKQTGNVDIMTGKKTGSSDANKDGGKTGGINNAYKKGGSVENAYGAKKTDKDIKDIANTKRQKPAMLCGGKSVKKMADGGGVLDTVRNAVMGTPEQNAIAKQKEAAYLRAKMAQKAAGADLGPGEQMAMGLAGMGQKLQPAAQAAPAGSTIPGGMKKGGKACK